jgi:hypothetical protein
LRPAICFRDRSGTVFAFRAGMDARTLTICLLLGTPLAGCRTNHTALLGDGSAGRDGEAAEPPQRPAPPPIVPGGLDGGSASPDAAPEDAATPVPDGSAPATDAAPTPMADATVMPPPVDARPPDLALPADVPPRVDVPDGCQMVSCDGVPTRHDCCRAWYFFGLESEDRNQVQRDQLVTSFSKGADVRASYVFDRAGQDGAVGMLLDRPRRVTAIRVANQFGGAAAEAPFVTAEAVNGTAGCAYPLAGGQADVARPLFCWGNRSLMPDRINIRIEAKGAGPANIRVTAVEVR